MLHTDGARARGVTLAKRRFDARAAVRRGVQPGTPVDRRWHWGRELVWGSADFEHASALARRAVTEGRTATIARALLSHEDRRALLAVFRAPIATVRLRPHDAARLRDFVAPAGRHIFSSRRAQLAQFVLEVPPTEAEYLAGKSRQALRTNLRHAARAGIKCERLSGYDDWHLTAEAILRKRGRPGHALLDAIGPPDPRHRLAFYAARDAYERPVAFAGTAIFGELAYLFTLMSAPDHPGASPSLWALNAFVALDGAAEGIRHLTVGSALRDGPGSQYLAHLLGYRVRNLRFAQRRVPRRGSVSA
jgi:hypothetical protein